MGNGVIINPPHVFKQPVRGNYQVQEVAKYEYGEVTYGTSITNFIKILQHIFWFLNVHRWISQV
jgi:hypothetical protein